MLVVIDPYLLHFDEAAGLQPVAADTLADMVRLIDEHGGAIPEDDVYWPRLWQEFGVPLAERLRRDREHKRHLDALRRRTRHHSFGPLLAELDPGEGFDVMFNDFGPGWVRTMRSVVIACARMEETILLTRLIPGRNAKPSDHKDYRHVFIEKTCWELVSSAGGARRTRIPCVCSRRNMILPWTCRYADGLPAEQDGGRCPFYPPEDWRERARLAVKPRKSRPCWWDDQNLRWAEPRAQNATGRTYHWDVYLDENQRIKQRNLGKGDKGDAPYINVARWRPDWEKDGQAAPGEIHHPPEMKDRPGWRRR